MRKIFIYIFIMISANLYAETTYATRTVDSIVSDIIIPLRDKNVIPGIAVAIYYQGKDYIYCFGIANKDTNTPINQATIFELASISKVFTTTLLAQQVQAGTMQLEDPVINYLPQLSNTTGLAIDQVTLIELATHTGSLPRDITQFQIHKGDINGLMRHLKTWQAPYPIGSTYRYSNISFGLLGMAIENAANSSYDDLLKNSITYPLHMSHTWITVPSNQVNEQAQGYNSTGNPVAHYVPHRFKGGGAVRSSAADMLAFMKANLGISVEDASPSLLAAMQLAQKPRFPVKPNFVMGLGWEHHIRNGHLFISKNGGNNGFSTYIGFAPKKQFGVVVLINQNKSNAAIIGNKILNQLAILQTAN